MFCFEGIPRIPERVVVLSSEGMSNHLNICYSRYHDMSNKPVVYVCPNIVDCLSEGVLVFSVEGIHTSLGCVRMLPRCSDV